MMQTIARIFTWQANSRQRPSFSTASSPSYAPVVARNYPCAIGHLSKQRAVIPQDRPRRVVAGSAGDAAAGMGAAAAMIESLQWPAIVGVTEHRPRGKQLVERQRAVENVAAEKPELPLQVEWGKD